MNKVVEPVATATLKKLNQQIQLMRMHNAFNADLDRQDAENAHTSVEYRSRLPATEWIEGYYDIQAALAAALNAQCSDHEMRGLEPGGKNHSTERDHPKVEDWVEPVPSGRTVSANGDGCLGTVKDRPASTSSPKGGSHD